MSIIKRGTQVPARWRLLACGLLLMASASLPARADDGIVDVHALPQLEGAVEDNSRPDPYRVEYRMPTPESVTSPAVKKLLGAAGWVPYVRPLEEKSTTLNFKKGRQGLSVHFTQALGRPDQSVVYYSTDRIYGNVPFPDGASDIVFDGTRPYLGCIAPSALDTTSDFYASQMEAIGWRKLTPETAARWTTSLDETVPNGLRVFYEHPDSEVTGFYKQKPVMLTLTRRDDGRTNVDIRVAPFALPFDLKADSDAAGLPRPTFTKSSRGLGSASSNKREMSAAAMAELPAVLAFYHRELAARGWQEDGSAPLAPGDEVAIKISNAEEAGVLRLGRKYDFTMVSLTAQVKESALAARAKAKKEADDRFFSDAAAAAKQVIAADEARRKVQAAALSDAPLNALADSKTPVPLPENAEGVKFEGSDGSLEFSSTSSVKALTAFYRASLKPLGWNERPSVINQPNMAMLEFARSGKSISFTVMQMGPEVRVSAEGSGLRVAAAKPADKPAEVQAKSSEPLKPDTESQLPVPTQRSSTSLATTKLPGTETPFRRELEASIPAPLGDVLAFYRTELGKLGWQEKADGAAVSADSAQIDFTSPQGPAVLKLGRAKGETIVNLAQKNPDAATKADIMPKPGQARVMLGNIGAKEASLTINKQTIKIAAGAGGPQSPKGPMLDLAPGKYQYALRVPGRPARTETLTVAAGDAWGLMVGPTGKVLPLQMY
ncbi:MULTISPECIES: hypothetical protein [Bradyrhizobium]|uniref:Bll0825 protein n=1 Tax=Bradyrhizobium diazoefficiens (strain JCM 10833 / BCRC 13528 / IAM 13628 / NBRC 14792 / USDA 110) TaxID=224911 RepID=Q89W68_BRADU|nr:hypothetical protein [Bradyrhizobium diazoefficiens]MBP1060480.1 hypothetical protein [Bradyrhizobium japonicum]AND86554.1 hypothetical protein AAV28_00965 [Bradyrhizobium diazoefficiens USDA 110]AWO87965.1 hypothetical protein DI395_04930 [Bradyrhizobium diazoefficiens]PDT62314.1 hypothetical protein CO678_07625 [Bradyrhizobium diazoefficiens]QBP19772.1 hypothetical protein Bdiaspc4_03920 [Bradyrhizobium diazoefficiens]